MAIDTPTMYNNTINANQPSPQSDSHPTLTFLTSATLFLILYFIVARGRKPSLELPPSPPADPVIGHVRVMSSDYQWKTFAKWSKTFGVSGILGAALHD